MKKTDQCKEARLSWKQAERVEPKRETIAAALGAILENENPQNSSTSS